MAKQFASIDRQHAAFISTQRIFFAGSSSPGARVNISPRPTEHLHVLGPNELAYLDLTGSGNETAAHIHADGRLTFMFCSFEGAPLILRAYGKGRVAVRGSPDYADFLARFYDGIEPLGARQVIFLDVDLVQSSCGYGVPLFAHIGERSALQSWTETRGEDGLRVYRAERNATSIDGLPTHFHEV